MIAIPVSARGQTTAETGITVTTEDAGTFAISFAGGDAGFTFFGVGGEQLIGISAIDGATADAVVELEWTDDRLDDQRLGYTIAVASFDLTSGVSIPGGTGVFSIPATNLAVIRIGDVVQTSPLVLDQARTVYESDAMPDAGEHALQLVLRLDVPASTYATSYVAKLVVQVTHGGTDL